jgi:hypothetical protein
MNDDTHGHERRRLRVQLELDLEHEPVRGLLRPERGDDQTFVGWLGFVDALKRLQDDRREQT